MNLAQDMMQKQTLTHYNSDCFTQVNGNDTELQYLIGVNTIDYEFYKVYHNHNDYGVIAIGLNGDVAEIHMEVTNFGRSEYKHMKESYDHIKQYCRDLGARTLIAPRYDTDRKEDMWAKFIDRFGFTSRVEIRMGSMEL